MANLLEKGLSKPSRMQEVGGSKNLFGKGSSKPKRSGNPPESTTFKIRSSLNVL